jgi:Epoxide hydrolase N terminus
VNEESQHRLNLPNRRKTESRLNFVPHFKAHIVDDDGSEYDIHFAALFSKKVDAVPLMMLHGWPVAEVSVSNQSMLSSIVGC